MSLLKAIKAQLGLSNTATNNFTLTAEAADGTMKLARGNAGATTQDILTVDAAGKISATQGYNDVLGSGQTWTAFNTTTRAPGTTYTNSTGKPIVFNYSAASAGISGTFTLTVAGVLVTSQSWGSSISSGIGISVVIPNGATYVYVQGGYTTSPVIAELR